MTQSKFHQSQDKLEDLLRVYQPHDLESLMTLFALCWDLKIDGSQIDLSIMGDEEIIEAKNKICNEYTYEDSKFIGYELNERYQSYREKSCNTEYLYGWCY